MYSELVLHSLPTDEYLQHQYWLRDTVAGVDIDADSAWLFTRAYPAIKVAIIDDSFTEHKDLQAYRILPGWDCYHGDADVSAFDDVNIHGQWCAGVLMAAHNDTGIVGVCGECLLLPYKVYSDTGRGGYGDIVATAIYQAYWNGAEVISWSGGFGHFVPVVAEAITAVSDGTTAWPYPSSKSSMVRRGLTIVNAAGNNAGALEFPSGMEEVIAVGASDRYDSLWYYSAHGEGLDVVAPVGEKWSALTHGDMWTLDLEGNAGINPTYTGPNDAGGDVDYTSTFGGTSAAAPQVAGIVALVMGKRLDLRGTRPVDILRPIIDSSAVDLGDPGWDEEFGFGRANAFRALLAVSRGDVDNDGVWDILDVVAVVKEAFRGGGPQGFHRGLADMNCDQVVNVLDVVQLVNIAFRGGVHPAPCYEYDY